MDRSILLYNTKSIVMKTISVIIPVYNSEKTIYKVLESINGQTALKNIIEIIIVDDGSQDCSGELIASFKESHPLLNILYFKQENHGVSHARNTGMKKATGELIALMDSDDLWLPTKIERQLQVLEENPDVVFLGAGYLCGAEKKETPLFIRGKKIEGLFKATLRDIYWKHFPATSSVIFYRKAIDVVGYFDEQQRYGEDINYFQKFCIYFNYYYLAEPLLHFSYNKSYFGSEGLSANFPKMHEGCLKNLRELRTGGHFSQPEYILFLVLFQLKLWRRVTLRWFNKVSH